MTIIISGLDARTSQRWSAPVSPPSSSSSSFSPPLSTFSLSTIIISGFLGGCIDRPHQSWQLLSPLLRCHSPHYLQHDSWHLSSWTFWSDHSHLDDKGQCGFNASGGLRFKRSLVCLIALLASPTLHMSLTFLWDACVTLNTSWLPWATSFLALLYVLLIILIWLERIIPDDDYNNFDWKPRWP